MEKLTPEKPAFTGLILLSGVDAPGVTEALFSTLAPFSAKVLDIEQVVIRGRLILTTLIGLDPAHASAIETDLMSTAERLGLDLAIDFSSTLDTDGNSLSNLHIVVLSSDMKPIAISAIATKIAANNGNIDRIRRTASYPLTAIEFEVSFSNSNIDLQVIRGELALTAREHDVDIAVELGGLTRRAKRIVLLDMDSTLIQQ